jgi:acetyl-CoA synthetase
VQPGERVFVLLGRVPELYIAVLGTLKARAVCSPLFAAFGPEPIAQRVARGEGAVLVTSAALYRRKVVPALEAMPTLRHVLLLGDDTPPAPGTHNLAALLDAASDEYIIERTDPEDPALLHFTSGTTGQPKGALHVHEAVVVHHTTAASVLDFHPDDVFWCTADPGWVTGTSYGIIAPLTHGITSIVDEADFDADRWYRVLAEEGVSVWYTAPTALRLLMRAGSALARERAYPRLRLIGSVGEALNPEVVTWGVEAFGLPVRDNWWQTETGGIMVANFPALPVRAGSMGRPVPGIEAALVERRADGGVDVLDTAEASGELALRVGWPSMFRGYYHDDARYARCFADGWYLTGDLARRDADGYYWFIARADDVIKSAGHLVGPFEVESALLEHEAVAEAAVIGLPDPIAGEFVKAYVVPRAGVAADEALASAVLAFARQRLGANIAPKQLAFVPELPRTRSGKIMRRLLRARELGLPEGDLSTLETQAEAAP